MERDLSVTCMCRYLIPERGGIRIGREGEGWDGKGWEGRGMSSTASGVSKCIWYRQLLGLFARLIDIVDGGGGRFLHHGP